MGLGPGEILLILVIAYVVVGPEDMGEFMKAIAKTLRQLRKLGTEVKGELEVPALTELNGLANGLGETVKESVKKDAAASVGADLDSVLKEIQKTEELLKK